MKRRKYRNIGFHKKYNTKLIISLIIFVLGIALIQLGIEFREHIIPIYSYEAKKDSQYIVRLKPNDFYEQETLPEDKYYASKSIDNFNVDFKYDFKANKQANLDYSYAITAELIGNIDTTDNKDKEVWNRNFNILDNNIDTSSTDKFSINQNIDINYENYNNLVNSYEKTYGIKIDATLKVRLNVYINVKIADLEVKKIEDNIELDIPITNTVTEVKKNYKNTIGQITPEIGKIQTRELVMYIIGGIFIAVSFIIFVIAIRKLRKERTIEEIYRNHVNKILKYYGELIVTVKNEPNIKNLEIIDVESVEDLVDVAEQTKTNIIRYETTEKNYLYIIVNQYVYRYIIGLYSN